MRLTEQEKMLLNGEAGEAVRLAMAILVELGEAIGAPEMIEIEHVHTDSGFYLAETGHHSCVVRIQRHCFCQLRAWRPDQSNRRSGGYLLCFDRAGSQERLLSG